MSSTLRIGMTFHPKPRLIRSELGFLQRAVRIGRVLLRVSRSQYSRVYTFAVEVK